MTNRLSKKLVRALERRFGKSILPYRFAIVAADTYRITDIETGSWIEASVNGSRVHVCREFDGAA